MAKKNEVAEYNPSPRLIELAQEAQEVTRLLTASGGELSAELEARLDFNNQQLAEKVDAYLYVEDELESQADLWKKRADACNAVAKRFSSFQDRLRDRVKFTMQSNNIDELNGEFRRYKLSTLKPKLVIDDAEKIPSNLKLSVTTLIPDKERIVATLSEGFEIPGVHLEPVASLRSYAVKAE